MDSDPTRPACSRLSYSSNVISGLFPALLSVRPSLRSVACAPKEGRKRHECPYPLPPLDPRSLRRSPSSGKPPLYLGFQIKKKWRIFPLGSLHLIWFASAEILTSIISMMTGSKFRSFFFFSLILLHFYFDWIFTPFFFFFFIADRNWDLKEAFKQQPLKFGSCLCNDETSCFESTISLPPRKRFSMESRKVSSIFFLLSLKESAAPMTFMGHGILSVTKMLPWGRFGCRGNAEKMEVEKLSKFVFFHI